MKKKFGMVIGNPPYQEETDSDSTRMPPVYNILMDAAHKVAEQTVLITPAKFLFNEGYTPKSWNKKMLNDPHFKVLDYAPDATKYFRGVEIKGGVAVTMYDHNKNFGAIGTFIPWQELKAIHQKVVVDNKNFHSLNEIMRGQMTYRLSPKPYEDFPDLSKRVSARTDTALRTNAFEIMPDILLDAKPDDGCEYVKILGRIGTTRVYRYIRRDYMVDIPELNAYKVFVPAANGCGTLYEVLSTPLVGLPLVGLPLVGCTQTFISVGAFASEAEAQACLAYIKSKFARAMLGTLKVTQHNPPQTWANVPLQDFTSGSDIDWHGDIDAQLYRKYGLTAEEINFIETHVKPMT